MIEMNATRKVTLSSALIVLVCFFLPWIQVSCGASKDSASGLNLLSEGRPLLWFIPVLMVLTVGGVFIRSWRGKLDFGALLAFFAGLISSSLMYRERLRALDNEVLVDVRTTSWFWLGFVGSIVLTVAAAIQFLRSPKQTLK